MGKWISFVVFIIVTFSIAFSELQAQEHNFCKNTSLIKEGNTYQACGVGEASSESKARQLSMDNAMAEFKAMCKVSIDCNEEKTVVTPLKTSCEKNKHGYKCYRGLQIESKGPQIDNFGKIKVPAALMIGLSLGTVPFKSHAPYFIDAIDIASGLSLNYATRTDQGNAHLFSFTYLSISNEISTYDSINGQTNMTNFASSYGFGYAYLWVSNHFFFGPGIGFSTIKASSEDFHSSDTNLAPLDWSSLALTPNVKLGYKSPLKNSFYILSSFGQNIFLNDNPVSTSDKTSLDGNLAIQIEVGYKKAL